MASRVMPYWVLLGLLGAAAAAPPPVILAAESAAADTVHQYRLFLQQGTLNGQPLSASQNTVVVESGRGVTGTLQILSINDNCGGAIVPVVYTPSWGYHASSWLGVLSHSLCGETNVIVPISLTAPAALGTYYIIFGSYAQTAGSHVASMSAWHCAPDVWNDGNDLADFEEPQISAAMTQGWVMLPGWECSHFEDWPMGLTYVKVIVESSSASLVAPYSATPPDVDGRILTAEWDPGSMRNISLRNGSGMVTNGALYVEHDGVNLYVAVQSYLHGNILDEYCSVNIDGDCSRTGNGSSTAPHVDIASLRAAPGGWGGYNYYAYLPAWLAVTRPAGASSASAGDPAVYEYSIPLSDLTAQPPDSIGMSLFVGTDGTPAGAYGYPYWHPDDVSIGWATVTLEAPPPPCGLVDTDDFEDGDAACWETWTCSGTTDNVIGPGSTLTAEGGVCARAGNYGLRVQRASAGAGADILELHTSAWTEPVRFSCDIRPFAVRSGQTHSQLIVLSEGSAGVSEIGSGNLGVQFTADGKILARSPGLPQIGLYSASEWCHVEINVDPGADLFSLDVSGPGVDVPIHQDALACEENLSAVNFIDTYCDQTGPNEFDLDNVQLAAWQPVTMLLVTPAEDPELVVTDGVPLPVTVAVRGADADSVILHYARGSDGGYRSVPMAESSSAVDTTFFSANVPADLVGPQGIRLYVSAHLGAATVTYRSSGDPMCIRVAIDNLAVAGPTPANIYRMISLPMTHSGGTVLEAFEDDLGSADATRWRAFRYVSGGSSYAEVLPDADSPLVQGGAFWLITKNAISLDSAPLAGTSTLADRDFVLHLSAGWNMIGNPFAFPVSWGTVLAGSPLELPSPMSAGGAALVEPPYWWDPARRGYVDSVAVLQPFEGYWVMNRSGGEVILMIPPVPASGSKEVLSKQAPVSGSPADRRRVLDDSAWSIRIIASADGLADDANVAAARAGATAELDPWDRSEPPVPPGRALSLAFPHASWKTGAGAYATDVRGIPRAAPSGEPASSRAGVGACWYFDIAASLSEPGLPLPARLDFAGASSVPSPFGVVLLDRQLGIQLDLRAASSHEFYLQKMRMPGAEEDCRFALLVGDAEYLESGIAAEIAAPKRPSLSAIGPNPFSAAVLLQYELPSTAPVALDVYNVAGERVRSLISSVRETGRHEIVWDGLDGNRHRVSAGIYFVQLRTSQERITRRVVLLR